MRAERRQRRRMRFLRVLDEEWQAASVKLTPASVSINNGALEVI